MEVPLSCPVGVGLVGLGRWGRSYLKTLSALPECRLVAIADPDSATHAAVAGLTGVTKRESAADLLSDPAVETVVIATPDHTHYDLSAAALAAGRDVLVEKPMTLKSSEAESLMMQAEDSKLVLGVGHTAVYSTDIDSLRIRLDELPRDARRVIAERTSSGPSAISQSPIANRQSSILFDLCPHDIALAVLLFGAPAAARAVSSGKDVEYAVRFGGDELLEGRAEWRQPPQVRRFEVAGQRRKRKVEMTNDGTSPFPLSTSPLGLQCLDFIRCCRTRRQPHSNGQVGLWVVRCLEALASSAADRGEWVQLESEQRMSNDESRAPDFGLRTSELGVHT